MSCPRSRGRRSRCSTPICSSPTISPASRAPGRISRRSRRCSTSTPRPAWCPRSSTPRASATRASSRRLNERENRSPDEAQRNPGEVCGPFPGLRFAPSGLHTVAPAMIEIEGLSKSFDTARSRRHLALTDISMDVADGAFVSVLGPSGCGKSTLLYVVGGFIAPSTGSVRVNGRPVTGPGRDRGPVFQEFALFPWKTVLGNVRYGLDRQGMPGPQAEARARALIDMVHLGGYESFYPKELS